MQEQVLQEQEKICDAEKSNTTEEEKEEEKDQKNEHSSQICSTNHSNSFVRINPKYAAK